ncbi:MAG TPA: DUF6569 family protein [Phycisphaerae bacterium]|nr:DUF6569 family protein [Phycisphaerae bacterium]
MGVALLGLAALGLMGCVKKSPRPEVTDSTAAPLAPRLTGPYQHENLVVYLVHSTQQSDDRAYLTLAEALEQKKVVVHETGSVNELAVENTSDQEVFIQAGEIVRGGKQDRTLGTDLILARKSGRVPITSFCVEAGRWQPREAESGISFEESTKNVSSNSMKMAVQYGRAQDDVWEGVAAQQRMLASSVNGPVADEASPTSLELTLDNEMLQKERSSYVEKLSGIINGKNDAVGMVFAINGKMNCADVYAAPALFRKLWPKLLDAAAVEAIGERDRGISAGAPSIRDAEAFLAGAEKGRETRHDVAAHTRWVIRDESKSVMFESSKEKDSGNWVHRNYLAKLEPAAEPRDSQQMGAPNAPEQSQQRRE